MSGSKRIPWWTLWLFATLPLTGWWLTGLFDLDEGFYGSVVAEMNRRGEWITPYFNGHPWFEKPVLTYWVAKPLVALFGHDVGPRLCSVLATLGCYAFVVWFVKRRVSEAAAAWSLTAMSTMLLVVALGRMLMTDALLNLALVVAMLSFWESLQSDYRWRWLTAFALGLAVLAKGPVALILFALIAGWTFWRERELRLNFRKGWLVGTGILVAVVGSWYGPAYAVNGQVFVDEFLIKQNLQRFTGGDAAHTLPLWKSFWFYIPILLIGTAPWWWWLRSAWPSRRNRPSPMASYLASWALIVFAFFSISGAKLPHYILPCCMPLAILVGGEFAAKRAEPTWRNYWPSAVLAASLCVVANGAFLWWYARSGQQEAHALIRELRGQEPVVAYQLPRRSKDMGTGKPVLQETSLPSLPFELGSDILDLESTSGLSGSYFVFTRAGRPLSREANVASLTRVQTRTPQVNFEVWQGTFVSR